MSTLKLVNGQPSNSLPLDDRGLAYGHGVFETIQIKQGRCLLWARHMKRLLLGCQRLSIPADALESQLMHDCSQLPLIDGVLKIIVTRGSGGRGYAVADTMTPNRIVQYSPNPQWADNPAREGIRARWCETRLASQPLLAGIKHLNRLEQVLARAEWQGSDIREGLLRDYRGHVVEGTMSNLFFVVDGRLSTPALHDCGVAGVMRDWLLEGAAVLGIDTEIDHYRPEQIEGASELFVCNSLIDIWPIVALGDKRFEPGPVTRKLQSWLQAEYSQCD